MLQTTSEEVATLQPLKESAGQQQQVVEEAGLRVNKDFHGCNFYSLLQLPHQEKNPTPPSLLITLMTKKRR
jgi:hypothetical protein